MPSQRVSSEMIFFFSQKSFILNTEKHANSNNSNQNLKLGYVVYL